MMILPAVAVKIVDAKVISQDEQDVRFVPLCSPGDGAGREQTGQKQK